MTRLSLARLAAPLALTLALGGCALNSPSIADIKYNPGRYHDRTVSVEGVVTSSWGVPLVPFKLYKVDDGTGEMTVVANNGRTPSKGSRVRVKGRVNDVALGVAALAVVVLVRDDDAIQANGDMIAFSCKEPNNTWYAICIANSWKLCARLRHCAVLDRAGLPSTMFR